MLENALNFCDGGVFYAKFVLKNVHADVFKIETNLLQNVLRSKFGIKEI